MTGSSQKRIRRVAVVLALLLMATAATTSTAAAHQTTNDHCHVDVVGGATFVVNFAKSVAKTTLSVFQEPVGYVENPFVSECHSGSVTV